MGIKKKIFMCVIALGMSPIAFANTSATDNTWASGIYIGFQDGYGMTNLDSMDAAINDGINAFASRIYFGYDLHKNFAVEVGHSRFFNEPSINSNGTKTQVYENTWALDLMGVIRSNVVGNFGLFARLGPSYLQTDHHGQGSEDLKSFNLAYGTGVYYAIGKEVFIDVSWMRYNGCLSINNDYQPYSDLFAIGLKVKF
jgi:hypothetical protein